MSLNNIHLQPQMLADLYTNSLLEISTNNVPGKSQIRQLGKNQKQILVVVAHDHLAFLPDEELSFLTTILSACGLSLADIAIINLNSTDLNDLQFFLQSHAKTVLLFGIDPLSIGLPINFPQFQLQSFDKRMYLYAPTLCELEKDKTLKLKLWNALKSLFGI